MSRLFPDRVFVALAPSRLTVERRRGGLGRAGVETQHLACDPRPGSQSWQGALAALSAIELPPCRVTLELSNHFVRYALVPWSGALATPAEEEAYVRHHFGMIHGERAKAWAVRATGAAPGAPRLASAVDRALLEAISAIFKGRRGVTLASIQPQLMGRFNAWRDAVPPSGAWVVMAEPDRACIALHGRAGWRSVQNAKGSWRGLLERERYRVDGDIPDVVLLAGASAPAGDGAWKFRAMAQ